MNQPFDLQGAFLGKQASMEASFSTVRAATGHPGTKGDESEADWLGLLQNFLPSRYEVGPIFAVDATGAASDQIDVAIFDQQYSPQWFGTNRGVRFVPVESVYAVFEVKPTLTAENIRYAADKVASVRNLKRTSAPIIHAGGRYVASPPEAKHIIGGILTTRTSWTSVTTADMVAEHLPSLGLPGSLDIGIALDTVAFDYTPDLDAGDDEALASNPPRTLSQEGHQLIHFAIRLFRQLQLIGTALALDLREYEKSLQP